MTVVSLDVESLLNVVDVNRINAGLVALVDRGARRLVIDLQKVKFAGSAALGMLLGLAGDLHARGGRLVLANAKHVEPLLKITRARGLVLIAPDTIAAMELAKA